MFKKMKIDHSKYIYLCQIFVRINCELDVIEVSYSSVVLNSFETLLLLCFFNISQTNTRQQWITGGVS